MVETAWRRDLDVDGGAGGGRRTGGGGRRRGRAKLQCSAGGERRTGAGVRNFGSLTASKRKNGARDLVKFSFE
jgi:hypothetical protein